MRLVGTASDLPSPKCVLTKHLNLQLEPSQEFAPTKRLDSKLENKIGLLVTVYVHQIIICQVLFTIHNLLSLQVLFKIPCKR